MRTLLVRRYDTGQVQRVTVEGGQITTLTPALEAVAGHLPWLAPGFLDLQVNGYAGHSFSSPDLTTDEIWAIAEKLATGGVTHFLPTIVTGPAERIEACLANLNRACREPRLAEAIVGIHLEGPYISPEDGPRGAHPLAHCREPNWQEFARWQQVSGDRIRVVTLSPEYPQAPEFIARATAMGVVIAIGHTKADSAQIAAAVEAGARFSTHLGNGAHGQIRRHPNYIWDQLADDRLTASLICDGHHLPPAVVKCFVRGKTPARCLLVSDVTEMAGLPPGRYETPSLGAVEVLPGGRLVVAGQSQYLAGAALPLCVGVANVIRFAEIPLAAAIDMASLLPRQLLGIPGGRLTLGGPADLVLFDWNGEELKVLETLRSRDS